MRTIISRDFNYFYSQCKSHYYSHDLQMHQNSQDFKREREREFRISQITFKSLTSSINKLTELDFFYLVIFSLVYHT